MTDQTQVSHFSTSNRLVTEITTAYGRKLTVSRDPDQSSCHLTVEETSATEPGGGRKVLTHIPDAQAFAEAILGWSVALAIEAPPSVLDAFRAKVKPGSVFTLYGDAYHALGGDDVETIAYVWQHETDECPDPVEEFIEDRFEAVDDLEDVQVIYVS